MIDNESHIYVIFGASGDLTKRKLVPALYSLFVQDLLPEKFALLGVSRSELADDEFRLAMKSAINEFKEIDDIARIDDFVAKIYYEPIKFDDASSYLSLKKRIELLRKARDRKSVV
jgi:glucose-6-phosphate 1-dehydrogenase